MVYFTFKRKQDNFNEFQHLLSENEFAEIKQKQNRPKYFTAHTRLTDFKTSDAKEILGAFK